MNFWMRMFWSSPWNASMTLEAAIVLSASTTPMPCVPCQLHHQRR
jgi:hypothetical protein